MSNKGKILVIEDNRLNFDMACELLDLAGFETFFAEDAINGIKTARDVHPDLILMDLHMPYTDGFTATQTIKSDPDLKAIPIVAFTALAMREEQEKALAVGCSGVISKPIDVSHFAETVEDYLVKYRSGSGHTAKAELSQPAPAAPSEKKTELRSVSPSFNDMEMMQGQVQSSDIAMSHKVLVVDDNAMNVELLKDALESMGQHPIPAYSGKEAIEIAKTEKPDLILLDIMMPDLDGYGVLDYLKNDAKTAQIPVIFISALNKTQDMVRGLKQNIIYDYITKPFKVEEVKARILASLRIKDLQDSLRSERDKLNAIFMFSADGIVLLDANLEVVSANPVFGDWFSQPLSAEGKPDTPVNFLSLIGCQCASNSPCPLHTENIRLVYDMELPLEDQVILENATIENPLTGGLRYLNIHCGRVPGIDPDKPGGYVMVLRDVTQEKTIQQSKETFVATLTHDLKTPIRAEYQALELLRSEGFGPLTPEQQDILREIIQSNRYMSRLVESLLTTYMYEEGKMELKLEKVDLNELIRKEIYGPLLTLCTEKNQKLALDLEEDLPELFVDPIEIQRVLNNLVQNAITYTPEEGTITISTDVTPKEVVVSVSDTGRGIEPEHLGVLFERYKTMAKRFKQIGTGLGLYLSRMIILAHGGQIQVESEVGKGSRFYFTLPLTHLSNDLQPSQNSAVLNA